jgi:hypothetical protein
MKIFAQAIFLKNWKDFKKFSLLPIRGLLRAKESQKI